MGLKKLEDTLQNSLQNLEQEGRLKGKEMVITGVRKAQGEEGPRYFLKGKEGKLFIRMNSNSYLGLSLRQDMISAGEEASRQFGTGPGAVRFISGTLEPHRRLEKRLANFHSREDAIIFSSAYATMLGVVTPLITTNTIIISDELNHNCIINAIRLSRPLDKMIYNHLDLNELEAQIKESMGRAKRIIIITDGIFSMRGDYAPLAEISKIVGKYDVHFPEGVVLIVDDSHGVGCFGPTGRGTEEYTQTEGVDILIGTLGKAFGVNGGYVVSSRTVTTFLRENAPLYIYSNPISAADAAEAHQALEIIDSPEGKSILQHLHKITKRFETGLKELGYEIIESDHPIVPLMVRDTQKTREMVDFLLENGILVTGLNFPVVPRGDEEIRFQVNADHTTADIDTVLKVLKEWKNN
ncbi:MAG: aminotransferase class I/II-fold pyridoxal phosphate-dependent enzyme [Candidatus Atribacteria bacterium]|mgnify:CR=1 FL=1|nr:aminotransferase class I/II-fold pyridoxal phosphate-dependent enzyme [Candidatus Atribacteria bacterium]